MVGIPIDLTDLGTLTNEQLMPFTRASGGGGSASGGSAGGGSLGGAGVERPWHVTGLRTKVETPQQWMVNISTYRPPLISTDLHQPPPTFTNLRRPSLTWAARAKQLDARAPRPHTPQRWMAASL